MNDEGELENIDTFQEIKSTRAHAEESASFNLFPRVSSLRIERSIKIQMIASSCT